MANIPADLRYTVEHEYIRDKGDGIVEIGITDFAQSELGDIVYVELPKVGTKFARQEVFGTIEAVKAVSELFAPASGEIVEINEQLDGEPSLVNSDAFGAGWMIRMKLDDPSDTEGFIDAEGYRNHIGA